MRVGIVFGHDGKPYWAKRDETDRLTAFFPCTDKELDDYIVALTVVRNTRKLEGDLDTLMVDDAGNVFTLDMTKYAICVFSTGGYTVDKVYIARDLGDLKKWTPAGTNKEE